MKMSNIDTNGFSMIAYNSGYGVGLVFRACHQNKILELDLLLFTDS